ncbi:MAG: energy transducer TonB [Xanthomonadaceae bacterium]|nr:energy transducer TonB [Xanthomonadaceae bacterium]
MSSANLAVAQHAHPDTTRIVAISAAIALNLAVIVIASRPITSAWRFTAGRPSPVQWLRLIDPPAVSPPPPPIVLKPLPHPATLPRTRLRPTAPTAPPTVPVTTGRTAMPANSVPTPAPADAMPHAAAPPPPVEASLAYRSAPLRFPIEALRQRMQGTVLLRVLVDAGGKPIEVVVERSSGYPLLDRSAREQVLASWRFQPAQVHGRPVRAWARVPISFDLRAQ